MVSTAEKNPAKVRAGTIGAAARWGPERRQVDIRDLSPEQRRLVLALVEAARASDKK